MDLGGRQWSCVLARVVGEAVLEQWCPRGEIPSRATMLLSRTRWPGGLGVPPGKVVQYLAAMAVEGSVIRPTLRPLYSDGQMAAALLIFEDDILMGHHWRVELAGGDQDFTVACSVEAPGSPPASIESVVDLAAELVLAPNGVPAPYAGPTADVVHAAVSSLELRIAEDTLDADVEAVYRVVRAAEELPLGLDANACLATLAARLVAAPGADFFGFLEESLRIFRVLLNRTSLQADPATWALYARGALMARPQLTAPRDLTKLAAACEGSALRASFLSPRFSKAECLERAVMWHAAGEFLVAAGARQARAGTLLVRAGGLSAKAGDETPYERAVTDCTRSYEAAQELGKGFEWFGYNALECRARAQRGLGAPAQERATLAAALELAPAASPEDHIKARLRELAAPPPPPPPGPGPGVLSWWETEGKAKRKGHDRAVHSQTEDRVIHLNPFRVRSAEHVILVLRPLVTALAPTVPNRFVAPFRHSWRPQDEPPAMTFEETLTRALSHRFGFYAIGAEFEAWGVGRFDPGDPEAWKYWVEVMTRDPHMCRIVLVYPSDTPGLQWELDQLTSTAGEGQGRFFLIPPDVDAAEGRAAWDRARRALKPRHLEVPPWHPDGLIFCHDARGALAVLCDTFEAVWDGRFAELLQDYAKLVL